MKGRRKAVAVAACLAAAAACAALAAGLREAPAPLTVEEALEAAGSGLEGTGADVAAGDAAARLLAEDEDDLPGDAGAVDGFLEELGRQEREGEECPFAGWRTDRPLQRLGEEVLGAYEDAGRARVATSGYLDLHGRVWGAVVQVREGTVDLVVLSEDEDGSGSTARIVRLGAAGLTGGA